MRQERQSSILVQYARELAVCAGEVAYHDPKVQQYFDSIREVVNGGCAIEDITKALDILIDHIGSYRDENVDSNTQVVAMTAGLLVEMGASAKPLAEVLIDKVPIAFAAGRRFANACFQEMDDGEDAEEGGAIAVCIDGRDIPRSIVNSLMHTDRCGAIALLNLGYWTFPTVATLSLDREMLKQATLNEKFCAAARCLQNSPAPWLHVLMGVELDATWLVACPRERRAFYINVDGLHDNRYLHVLIADILLKQGIPGEDIPGEAVDFCRGEVKLSSDRAFTDVFRLYTYHAATYDWSKNVPLYDHWVSDNEDTTVVPLFKGMRTLIVGPQTEDRVWRPEPRMFQSLKCNAHLVRELELAEFVSFMEEMKAQSAEDNDVETS